VRSLRRSPPPPWLHRSPSSESRCRGACHPWASGASVGATSLPAGGLVLPRRGRIIISKFAVHLSEHRVCPAELLLHRHKPCLLSLCYGDSHDIGQPFFCFVFFPTLLARLALLLSARWTARPSREKATYATAAHDRDVTAASHTTNQLLIPRENPEDDPACAVSCMVPKKLSRRRAAAVGPPAACYCCCWCFCCLVCLLHTSPLPPVPPRMVPGCHQSHTLTHAHAHTHTTYYTLSIPGLSCPVHTGSAAAEKQPPGARTSPGSKVPRTS
jgi:hypothetical protein